MNIKLKLKERLLNIPLNYSSFREKHSLASDLNVRAIDIEILLNELCEKNILLRKI